VDDDNGSTSFLTVACWVGAILAWLFVGASLLLVAFRHGWVH
jgi:hypothetical protein